MRLVIAAVFCFLAIFAAAQSNPEQDLRMKWWRDARFGLFIHWGLYSIPAGKFGNQTNYGEWIRDSAQIPVKQYEKYQKQFNPTKFNADQWASYAKNAGMQYIVVTTKHHDGFNMFHSKYSNWDISHTPFHRDVIKELADATRKRNLHMGFYHSIMDWHHPDYLPRRPWEVAKRPVDGANFARYEQYLHNEVRQLLTEYGAIDIMWFDGQWESTWNSTRGKSLFDLCRKVSPHTIVNDRVSSGLPHIGDYTTPEQYIPDTGIPGQDWETCMTMNDHWGYNAYDTDWKSSPVLIRNLVDIVSKGGNYLLNVGPMSNGEFPLEAVTRLQDIGAWMHVNSESIYDTQASVFDKLRWGRSTTRRNGDTTTLYLQVFDWPKDGKLVVPSIANAPVQAKLLGGSGDLAVSRADQDIVVNVPTQAPSPICSVVRLTVKGAPVVYRAPSIQTPADVLVNPIKVAIAPGSDQLIVRYTTDGTEPTNTSPQYIGPFTISGLTTINAASFEGDHRVSEIVSKTIYKASPWPATTIANLSPGLNCAEYKGNWDLMPDFAKLKPRSKFVEQGLSIPRNKEIPEEYVGRVYSGYIDIQAEDVYDIALTSDDGSKLFIDGKLVVDNDGLHGAVEKHGTAPLAKGWHRLRIEWFNKTGDAAISVRWAKAGDDLKPLGIHSIGYSRS